MAEMFISCDGFPRNCGFQFELLKMLNETCVCLKILIFAISVYVPYLTQSDFYGY